MTINFSQMSGSFVSLEGFNQLAAAGKDAQNRWFSEFAHNNAVAISPSGREINQPASSLVASEEGVSAALRTYKGTAGGVQEIDGVNTPSVGTPTPHEVLTRSGGEV